MRVGVLLREVALVAAVASFQIGTARAGGSRGGVEETLDALGVLLLVAGPLTLPLRHRAPWLTVGASVLTGIAYFSLGYPGAAIFATVVVALVSLRRRRHGELREAREREQQQQLVEERLAIARELHDVLAHSISVIRVQAGVALHLMDSHPEQVRTALEAITAASDEGMRELRAAVGTLRRNGDSAADDLPMSPAPGLHQVDSLVHAASGPALSATATRTGWVRELPPEIELAAYRVIQEALTNTVRHSGAHTAQVDLAYGKTALVVQVDDDGTTTPSAPPGNGLRGMRERVLGLGGSLTTGPRPAGGFTVRAEIPLPTA